MRIHITGASGSGTTTLAAALALELDAQALDADAYYWLPSAQPFTEKRQASERLALLLADLASHRRVILSGSVLGWGAALEDAFDLIVFLYLDAELRVERLRQREIERFGHADPAFLEWAALYDQGPSEGRSLAKHRQWLQTRTCPIIELSGDLTVDELVRRVIQALPLKP